MTTSNHVGGVIRMNYPSVLNALTIAGECNENDI